MSYLLIANLIPFINLSNFLKRKKRSLHYDIYHNTLGYLREQSCNLIYKGKILFSILLASVICLQISMQEDDALMHTIGKCHLCTL